MDPELAKSLSDMYSVAVQEFKEDYEYAFTRDEPGAIHDEVAGKNPIHYNPEAISRAVDFIHKQRLFMANRHIFGMPTKNQLEDETTGEEAVDRLYKAATKTYKSLKQSRAPQYGFAFS